MNDARQGEGGFTLIEVLVSLTILGISLAVLLNVFSTGLDLAHATQAETTATSLAQSLLDQVGSLVPLREGDVSGQFDDQYTWQVRAEPYGIYEDRQSWPTNALIVTVTVRWQDGDHPRAVSLTTLRLAAPEGA
jgi:general secretion pathway protein I